jgi:hypothetical protein
LTAAGAKVAPLPFEVPALIKEALGRK